MGASSPAEDRNESQSENFKEQMTFCRLCQLCCLSWDFTVWVYQWALVSRTWKGRWKCQPADSTCFSLHTGGIQPWPTFATRHNVSMETLYFENRRWDWLWQRAGTIIVYHAIAELQKIFCTEVCRSCSTPTPACNPLPAMCSWFMNFQRRFLIDELSGLWVKPLICDNYFVFNP